MPAPTFNTYADIKFWVMSQADEGLVQADQDASDFNAAADLAILEYWRDLTTRHAWLGLRKYPPGAFITNAPVTTLLVTGAAGAPVVLTLSGAPPQNLLNWKVWPAGANYIMRITAHVGTSTSITVDAAPTALTNAQVTIFQDEYTLNADLGVFVDGLWTQAGQFISVETEKTVKEQYPSAQASSGWPPRFASRISKTMIRFASYPTVVERIEYPYCYEPADPATLAGTLPLDPHLRVVLARGGLSILMDMKSDARANKKLQLAEASMAKAWEYEERMLRGQFGGQGLRPPAGPYR